MTDYGYDAVGQLLSEKKRLPATVEIGGVVTDRWINLNPMVGGVGQRSLGLAGAGPEASA